MIVCGYLISKSWDARSSSPVILAMDKKQRAVWEIPFPAITICPTDKRRPTNTLTKQEENDVNCAMNLVCEKKIKGIECNNSTSVIHALVKNSPKSDELFVSTSNLPQAIVLGPSVLRAEPILAVRGICYSINMLPGSAIFADETFHKSESFLDYNEIATWDVEEGYKKTSSLPKYPTPAIGAGEDSGLIALLKNTGAFNKSCTFIHGFEIQVHNPADFPSGVQKHYAPLNSIVQVFVTPEEVITDDLRSYTPEQRQCYYSDEHKLELFNVYTQNNCELECLSKVTLQCCGCVVYYMPRHNDTQVCSGTDEKDLACMVGARDFVTAAASGTRVDNPECGEREVICKCLPSCTHIHYRYQVTHTQTDRNLMEEIYRESHNVTDIEDSDFTIIQVMFTESLFVPFRRLELYGTVEFLANCGGVLGLCLGISVLSIIELLYWLLVRPFCRATPVRDIPKEAESVNFTAL